MAHEDYVIDDSVEITRGASKSCETKYISHSSGNYTLLMIQWDAKVRLFRKHSNELLWKKISFRYKLLIQVAAFYSYKKCFVKIFCFPISGQVMLAMVFIIKSVFYVGDVKARTKQYKLIIKSTSPVFQPVESDGRILSECCIMQRNI